MEVKVDTSQTEELERFFDSLSKEDQKKVWMEAFRKAARPLVRQAKSNAPVGKSGMVYGKPHAGGNLQRSIGTLENPSNTSMLIGSLFGKKAWYARFTESGTKERELKGKGKYPKGTKRGFVIAKHWFERAYESTEEEVYGAIRGEWENALQKRIDVLNARKKIYGG